MIDGTSVFIWWNLWTRELKHDLNSFEFEGDEKRSRRGQKRLRIGWEEVEKRSRSGHKRSRRGWEEVALGRAWEEVGKRLRRGWQEVEKNWEELRRAGRAELKSGQERWGWSQKRFDKIWAFFPAPTSKLALHTYEKSLRIGWEEMRGGERGWEEVRHGLLVPIVAV